MIQQQQKYNVTSYINSDNNYLIARNNYIDSCLLQQDYIMISAIAKIHREQLIEKNDRTIKETYYYNDEYNHQSYYTVLTNPIITVPNSNPIVHYFKSVAYISDINGIILDDSSNNIVCNYGETLMSTHYAAVFDLNFESYNIINNIYDDDNNIDDDNDDYSIENHLLDNIIDDINYNTIITNFKPINNDNGTDICSICIDNQQSDFIKTNCNHIFHFNCINNWIKMNKHKNNKCPYCRSLL